MVAVKIICIYQRSGKVGRKNIWLEVRGSYMHEREPNNFCPAQPNSINNRDNNFTIWALTRFWNFENWLLSYIFSSQNEKKPIIHRKTWLNSLFCLLLSLIFGNISEPKPNRCTRLSPLRSTTTLRLMNTAAFLRDLKKQILKDQVTDASNKNFSLIR